MDNYLKQILEKLNHIDDRVAKLEKNDTKTQNVSTSSHQKNVPEKKERDVLFPKVLALLDTRDELTTSYVEKQFAIDKKRAETILDELETSGYGTCYWSES